jgi:hypothetical protein
MELEVEHLGGHSPGDVDRRQDVDDVPILRCIETGHEKFLSLRKLLANGQSGMG